MPQALSGYYEVISQYVNVLNKNKIENQWAEILLLFNVGKFIWWIDAFRELKSVAGRGMCYILSITASTNGSYCTILIVKHVECNTYNWEIELQQETNSKCQVPSAISLDESLCTRT